MKLRHSSKATIEMIMFFVLADFEQKNIGQFFKRFANFWANFFCSKSAETKILLSNVDMGIKLNLINFLIYVQGDN